MFGRVCRGSWNRREEIDENEDRVLQMLTAGHGEAAEMQRRKAIVRQATD